MKAKSTASSQSTRTLLAPEHWQGLRHSAERLLPEDELVREEERVLLDLQARIEERLSTLAA